MGGLGLGVRVVLTEGNHDQRAGLERYGFAMEVVPFFEIDGVYVTHDPDDIPEGMVGIAGHLHPGVSLAESVRKNVRVPVFYLRDGRGLVLPSFSEFTGLQIVEPVGGERVFVVLRDGCGGGAGLFLRVGAEDSRFGFWG